MHGSIVILGFGAVGSATTQALLAEGRSVSVAQRSRPADLPPQAGFRACDVLDQQAVHRAVEGASQVVLAVGFAYDARVWRPAWPKPVVRSAVTRIWQAAAAAGRVRVAALRAPDFYGPAVTVSHLGTTGFGAIARGRGALLLAPPDTPHDFAYVPDIARAVVTLLDAPDDAYGQVWNMPCAPTRTPREILRLGAEALGGRLRLRAVPLRLLPPLGLLSTFMREVADVGFTWDRPYRVDGRKFTSRFWSDVTPFEVGAPATARSFVPSGRR